MQTGRKARKFRGIPFVATCYNYEPMLKSLILKVGRSCIADKPENKGTPEATRARSQPR